MRSPLEYIPELRAQKSGGAGGGLLDEKFNWLVVSAATL